MASRSLPARALLPSTAARGCPNLVAALVLVTLLVPQGMAYAELTALALTDTISTASAFAARTRGGAVAAVEVAQDVAERESLRSVG